jgi:hypothetical protein
VLISLRKVAKRVLILLPESARPRGSKIRLAVDLKFRGPQNLRAMLRPRTGALRLLSGAVAL